MNGEKKAVEEKKDVLLVYTPKGTICIHVAAGTDFFTARAHLCRPEVYGQKTWTWEIIGDPFVFLPMSESRIPILLSDMVNIVGWCYQDTPIPPLGVNLQNVFSTLAEALADKAKKEKVTISTTRAKAKKAPSQRLASA